MDRTTHHVRLSAAGAVFLIDARQILAHVERATVAAQRAARSTPSLRVGVVDASYDSMPLILHEVQQQYADLEIHQVEVGVPEQFERLVDGRLDVGHRAGLAGPADGGLRAVPAGPARGARRRGPRLRRAVRRPGRHAGRGAAAAVGGGPGPGVQPVRDRAVPLGRASSRPCTGGPSTASWPRSTWSRSSAACSARLSSCVPAPGGDRVAAPGRSRCRAIRGRCCGGRATPPSTSAPSSTPLARCPSSLAGCEPALAG